MMQRTFDPRLLDAEGRGGRGSSSLQGQDAYSRLLGEIRAGVLRPGDRLVETELARRLAISRTPVREAIRQLESEGLVTHQPRLGAVVRKLSYPEIMEIYEMRIVLEGTAARLAARSASEVEFAELAAINVELADGSADSAQRYELNRQFHTALIDAARNRYLVKSVQSIQTTLLILGPSTLEETSRVNEAVAEHEAVVAALRQRDEIGVESAMRQHMERAQHSRLRLLRSGGMLADPYPHGSE